MSHTPSEIILICGFAAQETFIIINVENSYFNIHIQKYENNIFYWKY